MARRASIRDVAEVAGVSPATVSKVLRGDATVTGDNRERVHAAVLKLDYRMDPLAANLRRGQRNLIGVIVPEFENPFFGAILAALEGAAEAEGFALVAMSSAESETREAELIRRMRDWRVAGVAIAPVGDGAQASRLIRESGLVAALVDRAPEKASIDSAAADDAAAAAAVADRLIGLGHRRILLVASEPDIPNIRARIDAFRARALALAPDAAIETAFCGLDRPAMSGRLAAALDASPRASALFSLFLPGLVATLGECRRRGWRAPQDVSVVSFDDADWLETVAPAISAVAQPARRIGAAAHALLLARIRGADGPPRAAREPCVFVDRDSVGPPPGAG